MGGTALQRVSLVLAGTGIVSSSTALFFLRGGTDRLALVIGYALYVLLVVLALRPIPSRAPFAYVVVAALALWTPAVWLLSGNAERMPAVVLAAAALAALWMAILVALRDAGREGAWRAGVGLLVIACVAAAADRHLTVASLGVAPDDVALALVTLVLPLVALAPIALRRREAVILGSAFAFYALLGIALVTAKPYDVDPPAIPHRAIELMIAGGHPYRDIDAQEALARFGIPLEQGTRLEDGTFLRSLNYPALAILAPAPFVALGLSDLRYLYLVEVLALAALTLARTRERWRPFVAAALIGNVVIARQEVLAGTDPLWAVLVAVAWLFRDRRWLSPIALGLAAAARQPAWFVVPFVLVAVAATDGWREAGRRALVATVAFLVPNLPFFVTAPREYLDGVFAPLLAPLVANGVGLVGFALYGPLGFVASRTAFTALALVVLTALLLLFRRIARAHPEGVLVFPLLVLYVAWRSLQNYFAFLGVFALLGIPEVERDRGAR